MALYIDKYFWLLLPITIILCCVFAARAAASFTEARVFSDMPRAEARRPAAPASTQIKRSKDGNQLAARNMFCATCTPDRPDPGPVPDPTDAVPLTDLPVVLVATNLSTAPGGSFASVVNTTTSHSGAFAVGQTIPGIGKIEAIRRASVDFVNHTSGRLERVSLIGASAPEKPAPERTRPGASKARPVSAMEARLEAGIAKVDETSYQIDRALFDEVTANPAAVLGGARVRPAIKNGKPIGMRLFAVRPNSAFAKLGLQNGDTLRSINGIALSSTDPDKLLEAYTKLRTASNLRLVGDRRGKQIELSYSVR